MIKGYEVLEMLRPDGGWIIYGNEYEGIQFIDCKPINETEFLEGFKLVEEHKKMQQKNLQKNRQEILDRLGITDEEARLLLG